MNTDTGRIYEGREAIEAARLRGEPLIELTGPILEAAQGFPIGVPDIEKRTVREAGELLRTLGGKVCNAEAEAAAARDRAAQEFAQRVQGRPFRRDPATGLKLRG